MPRCMAGIAAGPPCAHLIGAPWVARLSGWRACTRRLNIHHREKKCQSWEWESATKHVCSGSTVDQQHGMLSLRRLGGQHGQTPAKATPTAPAGWDNIYDDSRSLQGHAQTGRMGLRALPWVVGGEYRRVSSTARDTDRDTVSSTAGVERRARHPRRFQC